MGQGLGSVDAKFVADRRFAFANARIIWQKLGDGEVGAYKVQAHRKVTEIGTPEKLFKTRDLEILLLLRDLSQVVGRTQWGTPIPFYTRTSPLPIKVMTLENARSSPDFFPELFLGISPKLGKVQAR